MKAIKILSEVIAKDPEYVMAHFNRGIAHLHFGDLQQVRGEDPRKSYVNAIEDFDELAGRVAGFLINAVEKGNLTQQEADDFLAFYKEGLNGYTYLLKPHHTLRRQE
jgi:hypothetical protein